MDKITNYWYNSDVDKVNKYKHLIMLDLNQNDLDEMSNGDDLVKEYEDKVKDLNNQETFRSFMTYEEDQRLIQNTEKKMAYNEDSQNKQIEIAKNMLKEKLDIATISRMTGLDADTLEKLSHEIK